MYTRGHNRKLQVNYSRLTTRKNFFSQRVVNYWNDLPSECVNAPSVSSFKLALYQYFDEKGIRWFLSLSLLSLSSRVSFLLFFFLSYKYILCLLSSVCIVDLLLAAFGKIFYFYCLGLGFHHSPIYLIRLFLSSLASPSVRPGMERMRSPPGRCWRHPLSDPSWLGDPLSMHRFRQNKTYICTNLSGPFFSSFLVLLPHLLP